MASPDSGKPPLLTTLTNEPYQPVRIYYSIPKASVVTKRLRTLKCMLEVPPERCWQWLFQGEAAALRFSMGGFDDVPEERRPIILGRLRFPTNSSMTLETNSTARAVEGVRFLAARLGPHVKAVRCRVVNRFFSADDGRPEALLKMLDQNVTVIDPRQAEEEMRRDYAGAQSPEDFERVAAEVMERRIKSGKDVPLIEDFPLWPEEETPEFRDLATTLELRMLRAFEHWRGNTHLTLTAIIQRTVVEAHRSGGGGAAR